MVHFGTTRTAAILIVEDDAFLRMDAAMNLADAGFEILEASSADEAITILETRLDIRLVFTDVDMPGSMNGIKLAEAIRGRWPPIHIVATSGHHHLTDTDFPLGSRFLSKPYRMDQVVQTFRTMLAG